MLRHLESKLSWLKQLQIEQQNVIMPQKKGRQSLLQGRNGFQIDGQFDYKTQLPGITN